MSDGNHDSHDDSKKLFSNFKNKIDCWYNKKESTRPSAFRAVNNTVHQSFPAGPTPNQIAYPTEIFDLNNEYNPSTSIFKPKQDGVYSIIAGIRFNPDVPTNYSSRILIVVTRGNIITDIVQDNDFFGPDVPFPNILSVSGILQLSAGDKVGVFVTCTTNGVYFPDPTAMHFEAARFPSPLIKHPSSNSITYSSNFFSNGEF